MEGLGDRLSKSKRVFLYVFIAVVLSCSPGFAQNFTDQTAALVPTLPHGLAAWGDYNNDGYVDLLSGDNLWKNIAGTGFISTAAIPSDSLWGDYNNDGLIDVYNF